jgi:hypothetical protein
MATVALLLCGCIANQKAPLPLTPAMSLVPQSTIPDPAVPMIQLPTRFSTQRVNIDKGFNGSTEIVNIEGPGCIRHIWLLYGKNRRLEINVDGANVSQINLPQEPFFGIMHDLKPYFIDCAAYTVLPNPGFGDPGYNLWLPIPFAKSCRITMHGSGSVAGMVDWHQYDKGTEITPYRLHADYRLYKPAPERGGYVELANVTGEGFVAGVVIGYIQRDKTNMVFHTNGTTILLDGETNPHAIRGCNVEDDFGFSWGFNNRQSRWIGCPWHENRGLFDQDGVFYRFFGPDPIAFHDSLVFRAGCRADDVESVVYTYRLDNSEPPKPQVLLKWQVTGLFMGSDNWEAFQKSEYIGDRPVGQWPEPDRNYPTKETFKTLEAVLSSDHGWIDLQNVFFESNNGYTPLAVLGRCAYARTTIVSDQDKKATLSLALDDWAIVWLNGKKIATLRHEDGLKVVKIPVSFKKGANELLVKTNNSDRPPNRRLWVIHCAVE